MIRYRPGQHGACRGSDAPRRTHESVLTGAIVLLCLGVSITINLAAHAATQGVTGAQSIGSTRISVTVPARLVATLRATVANQPRVDRMPNHLCLSNPGAVPVGYYWLNSASPRTPLDARPAVRSLRSGVSTDTDSPCLPIPSPPASDHQDSSTVRWIIVTPE